MTDLPKRAKRALHNTALTALAPDLVRALIREREAADRLAGAVETLGIKEGLDCHLAQALAACRKAQKEADDDQ
jgi:hypothetical protein